MCLNTQWLYSLLCADSAQTRFARLLAIFLTQGTSQTLLLISRLATAVIFVQSQALSWNDA